MEKGVDRLSVGIDGRHAGGRQHHHALARGLPQAAQKGGLAGARLSGQKEVGAGLLHNAARELQFAVDDRRSLGLPGHHFHAVFIGQIIVFHSYFHYIAKLAIIP